MKYFDDFELGELRESPRRYTVTEEEIIEIVLTAGFTNVLNSWAQAVQIEPDFGSAAP